MWYLVKTSGTEYFLYTYISVTAFSRHYLHHPGFIGVQNIGGTLIQTADMTKIK